MLLKSRAELTSGVIVLPFAVGRQHSHVAFEFPSTLTNLSAASVVTHRTFSLLAPPMGKVDKQPAVVSGRFACILGAHLCELLVAFWLREGLLGALLALGHNESEEQSLGLLSNYQGCLVGRVACNWGLGPPQQGSHHSPRWGSV